MTNKKVLHIFDLIHTQEWNKLKNTLRINCFCNRSSVAKCSGPCSKSCKSTHSALHSACQFHPPLDVVKMLFKAHPEAVHEQDCKEQSVLHIACRYGCSPRVIKFLLQQNPEAAKKKDIENRTPFLTAFKSYVSESNKELHRANQDLLEVSCELFNAYPAASINEDCSRRNAVDYAIDEELHEDIVVYAQSLARTENRLSQRSLVVDDDDKDDDDIGNVNKLNMEQLCQMKHYVLPKNHKAMAA